MEIKDVDGLDAVQFEEKFTQIFIEAVQEDFEQARVPEAAVILSSWESMACRLEQCHSHQSRREIGSGAAQQ